MYEISDDMEKKKESVQAELHKLKKWSEELEEGKK